MPKNNNGKTFGQLTGGVAKTAIQKRRQRERELLGLPTPTTKKKRKVKKNKGILQRVLTEVFGKK